MLQLVDEKNPFVLIYSLLIAGFLFGLYVGLALGDFGTEGEPGVDDTHLDRPRYVRLADNGSMLISDHHRILEVDAAGRVVWEIRGTFCDITWLDNDTWVALNGTSTSACNAIHYSDGTTTQLPHQAQRLHPAGEDLVIGSMYHNISRVTRSGNMIKSCELVTGYISDISRTHYLYDGVLYSYNLTTCSNHIAETPLGDLVYSFQAMPNGTFAYGIGWNNGSRAVIWENQTLWLSSFPEDLTWNGTHLAAVDYNSHVVRTWHLDDTPLPPPDGDGDGVPDASDPCPTTWGNATDVPGCPDTDGDGTTDDNDPCPFDPEDLCIDVDGDGYNASIDACPTIWGNSSTDRLGCPDTDGDGTSDLNDPCPLDPEDRCDDPPPGPELAIISYDWNITDRSARLQVLLNHTCVVASTGGSWSGNNPYRWDRTGLEPNTTYSFQFYFENQTFQGNNRTWLNITDTTPNPVDPPPELVFTDVVGTPYNTSYLLEYMIYSDECYVVWGTSWKVYSTELGPNHWFYQYNFSDLLSNYTYTFQLRCVSPDGQQEAWLNHTGTTLADPTGDGGDGTTDGSGGPQDGDGDEDGGGPLEATPGGVPITYLSMAVLLLVGLSAAIFVGARPEPAIRPPRIPAQLPEVPWSDTELDELEDPLHEVADPTMPLASPDLFDEVPVQSRAHVYPYVPLPEKQFLPEAPSDPGRMPYLAIQVALAEDLPAILENLRGRVRPQVCDENRVVLKDVGDLEKRLRQLRDDRDIAPRQYDQLLREVEDLKRAVQNLTPLMERRGWDQ